MPSLHSVRRALLGLLTVLTAVALMTACSSSSKSSGSKSGGGASAPAAGSGGSTATSKDVTIEVKNFAFTPKNLTVSTGTKVTWKFDDSAGHTATANGGAFKSPTLSNGKTYSFTFNTPGTYPYICSIHQYMTATITVK
jgi:plastocyanin